MTITRTDPPYTGAGEREMLDAFLDYFRATLMMQCQDLSADDLRSRPIEPSSLSLLGLVSHMAEVEQFVRRGLVGGVG